MIELRGLTKSFRTVHGRHFVFRDLNLTFPDGANIGLIGPNGAGKSTLMRLIGGIDSPDRGSVVTNQRISFPVGLSGGFQGTLSGRDNAKFVCRLYGVNPQEVRDRVSFVEEFAELGKYFDMPIKTYSSGMRSRLIFGLSMAFDFDYYLMDEVGAVGDAGFKEKSRELLETKIGKANVICVSHNMNVIREQCTVVMLMQGGEARYYPDLEEGIRVYQGEAYVAPARPGKRKQPVRIDTISPRDVRRARRILRVVRKARRSANGVAAEEPGVAGAHGTLPDSSAETGSAAAEILPADARLIGHGQSRSVRRAARRRKGSRRSPGADVAANDGTSRGALGQGDATPIRKEGDVCPVDEPRRGTDGHETAQAGAEEAATQTVRALIRRAKRAARRAAREAPAMEFSDRAAVAILLAPDAAAATGSAAAAESAPPPRHGLPTL